MNSSPSFIIGLGRSGTTLLRLMLNSHPNIAIPYETTFITKYQKNIASYENLNIDANLHKLVYDILNESMLQFWDHEFDKKNLLNKVKEKNLRGVIDSLPL